MPVFMADILFQYKLTEVVMLTIKPNLKCGQYHKRMRAFITEEDKD
jgi:putative SOS response-associated peptidase YedK